MNCHSPKKWEYIIATIKVVELQGIQQYQETYINFHTDPDKSVVLNKIGSYGWELVGWEGEKYTFKREVNERMFTIKDPRY
jgi:hypothetical protein